MTPAADLTDPTGLRDSRIAGMPLGVAMTSFAALLLELSLTRLYSVVLFYHFAFLAISTALLGLGAGGVTAHLLRARLARWDTRRLSSALCAINALATVAVLEIVLHVPVSVHLGLANMINLTVLYLASAVPFFFTGVLFSVVFSREARQIPLLYAADLLGGAVACLALVPLLNALGAPNAILVAAIVMAAASAVWVTDARLRARGTALAVALAVLVVANRSGRWIDVVYAKGGRLDTSLVEFARWNAISRIEVDKQGDQKWIVIDADASSQIANVDPHAWGGTKLEAQLMAEPPSVANVLRPKGAYAIIGPGGGVDVIRAVANGSPSVTGIEINPLIATTVMRERYADFAHHLYDIPEVRIVVSDGRSFVRNSTDKYDVLQMTLVDTWASTAAGAFALSENNLYTIEAFGEYFAHLKPDGFVAITRWEFQQPREALRVVSVAMAALQRIGVANPQRHFIVVADGELDTDGTAVAVLAKKSAFTADEEAGVRAHLAVHPTLRALYLPSAPPANAYTDLLASNDPFAFGEAYEFDITPVTDNRPFFFFTLHPRQILSKALVGRGIDWKVNLGVVVLGMVLIISALAVLAFLVVPMLLHDRGRPRDTAQLTYFVAIGVGFMLVEIAFIQRFVLFLGHPTYALTVVVFLMLLSCGVGSALSRNWLTNTTHARKALGLIVVGVALYSLVLPKILGALVALPLPAKALVSAVLLIPLGIAMGMPFPSGLRSLATTTGGGTVEWAWAMNAGSSVLGSVLAIVIAINFGITATLLTGAAAYAAAFVLTRTFARGTAAAAVP